MLDVSQIHKDTEKVQSRLRNKEKREANSCKKLAKVKAREAVKILIPQIETKIKKAARKGLNSAEIFFYYREYSTAMSQQSLVEEAIASLLIRHFNKIKGLKASESDREDDCNAYYGTDIVISW